MYRNFRNKESSSVCIIISSIADIKKRMSAAVPIV